MVGLMRGYRIDHRSELPPVEGPWQWSLHEGREALQGFVAPTASGHLLSHDCLSILAWTTHFGARLRIGSDELWHAKAGRCSGADACRG